MPLEIATLPQLVIVVAPYLKAIVPVAEARTDALKRITPPAVVELTELVIEGLAALLNPTVTLTSADLVIPTVSVAVTCIEYVPLAVFVAAETTPEPLMEIPVTAEASDAFAIVQPQDEVEPVPPVTDGVEDLAVPNVVEIPGYEIAMLG